MRPDLLAKRLYGFELCPPPRKRKSRWLSNNDFARPTVASRAILRLSAPSHYETVLEKAMELITAEEMESLPDDPEESFVEFERICRKRMHAVLDTADQNDDMRQIKEEYMTLVAAAAKQCGVAEAENEDFENYNEQTFKRQYRIAVSAATRLGLAAKQKRAVTVATLPEGVKARLRKHLTDLEAALDAADLPAQRKKALKAKLAEFAAELEKERSNIGKICAVLALVSASIGGVEDNVIKLPKAVAAVMKIVGEVKGEELDHVPGQTALPAPEQRRALEAPTKTSGFSSDLDDEIPF